MKKIFVFLILLMIVFFGYYYLQTQKVNQDFIKNNNLLNLEKEKTPTATETQELQKEIGGGRLFLEVISPKDKEIVDSNNLAIKGKTSPLAEVYINERQIKADEEGNFSLTYFLEEGENEIMIVVNDDLGNYLEKTLTVELQTKN